MKDIILESPIYYSGSKLKNIRKGMINLFPNYIDTFIEMFCGSTIVSLNTQANRYILNDINKQLIDLIIMFKNNNIEDIINFFGYIRREIGFQDELENISFDIRSKNYNKQIAETHRKHYNILRNRYNQIKDIRLLYLLIIYSFSHQMRFNSNNEFNMPVGHDKFTSKINDKIINYNKFLKGNKVIVTNKDFRDIKIKNMNKDDFLYIDPPYLITTATYNENDGWTEKDEFDLYSLLEKLNNKGIKWGLSNVIEHKGKSNNILKNFIKNYNFVDNNIVRSSLGRGNANSREIYVCNYEIKNKKG